VTSLLLLLLLAQQYPLESGPIQPQTKVLWVEVIPDALPAQDPSQQIDVLWVISSDVTTSQTTADTLCTTWETDNNTVQAHDPANISRVHKVGCKIITYTSVNSTTDFNAVSTTTGSLYPQVNQWRNDLGADVVQFVTRSGDSCGIGYQCAAIYGSAYGYSWVSSGCAANNQNFSAVHEMGHNLCLAHDLPNQSPSYSYGSGFCDNVSPTFHGKRDPMVYPSPCGGGRVSYFGNPDISPFGYPFGDATCCNNARVWREHAAAVAAFRTPVTPPTCGTITLSPATLGNGKTGTAYSQTFTATGGTAPYTFTKTVGSYPAGLTFTTATLSGTPTTAGTSTFTLQATDSAACTGTTAYSLTILQLPSAPTNLTAFTPPQ
jgi:Putative Ig domain/Metallo-peptidase family M12B Reprolysin-like